MNEKQIIKAVTATIRSVVKREIKKYGKNADLNHIDTSLVTDMSYLFHTLKFDGDISGWDVSNVTDMSHIFADSTFTGTHGGISDWNVSNVESMTAAFAHSKFTRDISKWDVHNMTRASEMFFRVYI